MLENWFPQFPTENSFLHHVQSKAGREEGLHTLLQFTMEKKRLQVRTPIVFSVPSNEVHGVKTKLGPDWTSPSFSGRLCPDLDQTRLGIRSSTLNVLDVHCCEVHHCSRSL